MASGLNPYTAPQNMDASREEIHRLPSRYTPMDPTTMLTGRRACPLPNCPQWGPNRYMANATYPRAAVIPHTTELWTTAWWVLSDPRLMGIRFYHTPVRPPTVFLRTAP